MNEKLKQCPFCGGEAELCYSEVDTFCRKCNVMQETELWNTRPIEDDLRNRIAELVSSNMVMAKGVLDLKARIAELEAESERFTAHGDIERQDDKSPNDTQTQTFVYGKEREE